MPPQPTLSPDFRDLIDQVQGEGDMGVGFDGLWMAAHGEAGLGEAEAGPRGGLGELGR